MKKRRSNNFISRKIDLLFDIIGKGLFRISLFASTKTAEAASVYFDIKEKSKDLIKTNLEVAHEHIKNNNFFDAKLRYKFILKQDKANFEALSTLGYIYLQEKNFEKAKFFLEKSLESVVNENEKLEIEELLHKIKNHVNF
jgi:Flp pilus assembly protein TadD